MKFREKTATTKTENLAGGEAYSESDKLELVSLVLTSFVNDKFYESANNQLNRLSSLVKEIKDKEFVGKTAVYARTQFGMRSITHALIAELAKNVKETEWLKFAIEKTYFRPDDGLEMLAYYLKKYNKPIPNSLKKGLTLGVKKFDSYKLAKYRGENSDVKLVDLFNLIHPNPKTDEKLIDAYKKLMKGELKSTGSNETWESRMTQAGQIAETEEEKTELKSKAWSDLIKEKKLGYFALLRNLRNIMQQSSEVLDEALEQLTDEKAIRKSLVLPFRFITAMDEIVQISGSRKVIQALSKATDISLANVPKLEGKTLIALDVSGSMTGMPIKIGSLFAAALAKSNDADVLLFSDFGKYSNINPEDSLTTIASSIVRTYGGTDFNKIFDEADKKYDRIVILSDMQAWMGYYAPTKTFSSYKKRFNANPHIYSFDLNGHGTLQFPENQVYAIAGFSEKVFDIMKLLEEDRKALINKIDSIKLM